MSQYTAVAKDADGWWIGWIEEIAGANCQERTRAELLESVCEALELNRADVREAAGSGFEEFQVAV